MSPRRPAARRVLDQVPALCAAYVAGLVLLLVAFQLGGDRWWWATLLFFAPRWLWAVPLPPLLALLLARRPGGRRNVALGLLALGAGLLVGPILGFVAQPAALRGGGAANPSRTVRVLTANVEREAADGARLSRAIEAARPDVVALQEWDDRIVVAWPAGWRVIRPGPELLIASRLPFDEAAVAEWPDPPGEPVNMALAVLRTEFGPLHVVALHLSSPRTSLGEMASRRTLIDPRKAPALERALAARLEESRTAAAWCRAMLPAPLLVVGDFNMPDDSWIFRETWRGFTNAFRAVGFGFGTTVRASFGPIPVPSRIDHQLGGPGWRCRGAWIGQEMDSDHNPLVVEWEWDGPTSDARSATAPETPGAGVARLEESFDGVTPGSLPAGWRLWRNGRLARGGVIVGDAGRGGLLALDTDDSGADVRAWVAGRPGPDQELQLDLRLDSLNPIRLLVGGVEFDTRVPMAHGLELIRGMEGRLLAVEPDALRELARVKTRQWQESDWLRVTLRSVGGELHARIVRIADGNWLTPAGEWAPPPAGWTLSAAGVTPASGGLAGLWRPAGYTGAIVTDAWRLAAPAPGEPPDATKR